MNLFTKLTTLFKTNEDFLDRELSVLEKSDLIKRISRNRQHYDESIKRAQYEESRNPAIYNNSQFKKEERKYNEELYDIWSLAKVSTEDKDFAKNIFLVDPNLLTCSGYRDDFVKYAVKSDPFIINKLPEEVKNREWFPDFFINNHNSRIKLLPLRYRNNAELMYKSYILSIDEDKNQLIGGSNPTYVLNSLGDELKAKLQFNKSESIEKQLKKLSNKQTVATELAKNKVNISKNPNKMIDFIK